MCILSGSPPFSPANEPKERPHGRNSQSQSEGIYGEESSSPSPRRLEGGGQGRKRRRQRHARRASVAENHRGPNREAVRRRGDYAPGRRSDRPDRRHLHRQPLLGPCPGRPGDSRRPGRGSFRPGVQRQDDAGPARHRPGAAQGRHRRVHRRRARPRPQLGEEAGRRAGNAPGQPARQRRRGDAHQRDAHSLQRRGRDRDRLRGRPGA